MPKREEMITVTKDHYEFLRKQAAFLNCLEAAGVDNWGGYGEAWEMMHEEDGNDDEDL